MSRDFDPESEPERPPVAPAESDEGYVSEFLSESSEEYQAARLAGADARPTIQTPSAFLPSSDGESASTDQVRAFAPAATTTTRPLTPAAMSRPPAPRSVPWLWVLAVSVVSISMAGVAWVVVRPNAPVAPARTVAAPVEGMATIVSRPDGAEVLVDGTVRGVTPLRMTLPVGSYAVELRNGAAKRTLTLTVDPGTAVREFVDLVPGPGLGSIEVTTDVPGARVVIDGTVRGVTPLSLTDVEPGVHQVVLIAEEARVQRTVTVQAGATATVVASVVPTGATGGWLKIDVPIEMQVLEAGRLIGTTGADRIMLPAGRHTLDLVADPFEFRTAVTVTVGVGRTVTIPVAVPNGRLSINAVPWADVWLDGQALGSTPLANIEVPVGSHEVVWRHPQLGERRQSIRVPASSPARVTMDLNR